MRPLLGSRAGLAGRLLVLDGKTFADATMVIALGITMTGEKRFLGFVETDTENEKVLTPFLRSLGERGLDCSQGLLVILDGGKAASVLVAAEKRGRGTGRIRMGVASNFRQTTMRDFVKRHVTPGTTVYTDGLKGFQGLDAAGVTHVPRIQPLRGELRTGTPSVVPLADRAIGNLQQWLIGTYHGVSKAQLPVYLDEFVFRHNRPWTPHAAFQTLLGLGAGRLPTPYRRIRHARDLVTHGGLTTTCRGLLKQPYKHKPA